MTNGKRKYITGIDGLRAIAVIAVILYHLAPRIMPGGYLGVALFFVISGFLMTDILLNEWNSRKKIGLKKFYVRRIKRIYPSLLVMLIISGSIFWFVSSDLMLNFRQISLSSLFNVNNFWQIFNGSSYFDRFSNESPYTHLWSLSIEGQFYILWPIVMALLLYKKEDYKRLKIFVILIGTLSALLMTIFYHPEMINRLYYGTDTRLFSIMIGSLLAVVIDDYDEKINLFPKNHKVVLAVSSFIILFIGFFFFKDSASFVYQGGMFIFSVASALLLGSILILDRVNRLLTNPLFKWLGSRSYEIYLWQFPVMICYDKVVKWNGSHSWFHIIIQLIIILVLSEITYRIVYFLRFQVSYQKDSLLELQKRLPVRVGLIVVMLFFMIFIYSFAMAPTGRSEASQALEKQLMENQKKIAENQASKEKEEKSTEETTSEKSTETSQTSEGSQKESEAVGNKIVLTEEEKNYLSTVQLSAIGDSLLLSAAPEIQALFPNNYIDAQVGLQLMDSESLFKSAKDEKKLGNVVLVVLGTNGSFTTTEMANIMKYMSEQQVFFVNTMVERPWQTAVNEELIKTTKSYDNAHVIDWKEFSNGMTEWFTEDNVHLQPEGATQFANLIGKTIYDDLNK